MNTYIEYMLQLKCINSDIILQCLAITQRLSNLGKAESVL